ncbi:MAG: Serine/threonine-protein phosphatase [candidate division TM6 bacterium GW2011_GWF2_37_49]|nr:MAG: Serine/threonine-protein phosphatase [candidate division TM6 bacterium GW2011_GWF2_37_49]
MFKKIFIVKLWFLVFCPFLFECEAALDLQTECIEFAPVSTNKTGDYLEVCPSITGEDFKRVVNEFNKKTAEASPATAGQPHVQKIVVPAGSKICVMGDMHASLSLFRNFARIKALGLFDKIHTWVFLGDYVDRGAHGVAVLYTLIKFKLANWDNVYLLRGNHETEQICKAYGFFDEIRTKFGKVGKSAWNEILYFYANLPFALYIGSGDPVSWIQCCHGGIEPSFNPKDFLNDANAQYFNIAAVLRSNKAFNQKYSSVMQSFYSSGFDSSQDCGFNWCDFEENEDFYFKNGRGYSCKTSTVRQNFLDPFGLKAIFRGHQHNGYGLKIGGFDHWSDVVGNVTQFKINPYPIFTFSTAAESVGLPFDCFGILQTADKYEDWILTPYEHKLSSSCNAKRQTGSQILMPIEGYA